MLVKEIMNTEVKTCSPGITVQAAAKSMVKQKVGSLIVVNPNGQVVGIVTDGDCLRDIVAAGKDSKKAKVSEVMTKEVVMISPETTVQEAVDIMEEKGIKKLPVMQGNRLTGIVTVMDIFRVEPKLVERLYTMFTPPSGKALAG